MRGVSKMRVSRAEITGKFVEGFTPDKYAWWHIQRTVFSKELVDRRAPASRVSLAENFLQVAMKQFVNTVIHEIFPWSVI
ncbi:MAG: hypothetical protein ACREVW_11225 [Burkholderiales bacterium]